MKLCENSIAIFLTVICMGVSFDYVQGKKWNNLKVILRGNMWYNTSKMKIMLLVFNTTFDFSSPPGFSGVRATRSLALCVCFVDRCLSFWPLCFLFFVDLRILITPLVSSNSSWWRPTNNYCLEMNSMKIKSGVKHQ
jgi:hypothetical protein